MLTSDSELVILGSLSGNGISGPGGQSGPVFVEEGIMPGFSPGTSRFDGDLSLGPIAITVMEIGGTTPGSEHDQIVVAETFGLAGSLRLELINAYVPTRGTCLQLLEFGATTGSFDSVQLPQALIDLDADASLLGVTGELIIPEELPDLAAPFGEEDFFDVITYLRRVDAGDVKVGDVPPRDGVADADDVVRFLQLFED